METPEAVEDFSISKKRKASSASDSITSSVPKKKKVSFAAGTKLPMILNPSKSKLSQKEKLFMGVEPVGENKVIRQNAKKERRKARREAERKTKLGSSVNLEQVVQLDQEMRPYDFKEFLA
jgi:hypothetical protein